ncbi:hypothetical protein ACLB2K_052634 [Fragaria x ananassa]
MVDAVARGWRDNSGVFGKTTAEERILPVLNSKLGCHKTYNNYQSQLKWFKGRWLSYSTLMRFSFGFGYDYTIKRFTAPDEVWDEHLNAHKKDANLHYGVTLDYEDLEITVGNGVAVGKNSIGLGSATDARTLGDDKAMKVEMFPEVSEVPNQRRTRSKRSRNEYEGSSSSTGNTPQSGIMEHLDKLTTTFEGVYSLLEKRESLLEKRERDRAYTIWDAIEEIQNLDEDIRFKAFDLLDTKSKSHGFLKMAPKVRANWIFHKMRGQ